MEKENKLIQKYLDMLAETLTLTVHVIGGENRIVASTLAHKVGETIARVPADLPLLALPHDDLRLLVEDGHDCSVVTANAVMAAIKTLFCLQDFGKRRKYSQEETIVRELLSAGGSQPDSPITGYLKTAGMDVSQPRCVIVLEFEQKANRYFNINLDLGYDASAEELKEQVIATIRANEYLTARDIVAQLGSNQIVILKAFLQVADTGKIYKALDRICRSILVDLEPSKIFAFRLAYGNLYTDFGQLKTSYAEAVSLIGLGKKFLNYMGLYTFDDLLLEYMTHTLPQAAVDKAIKPLLDTFKRKDGTVDVELLQIAEGFVNEGLSLSRTAQTTYLHRNTVSAKLEKIKSLTGLDPENSFYHALLIKLAAIHLRLAYPGTK